MNNGQKPGRMALEHYRAMIQGRANRAQGAQFEAEIDDACEYYKAEKMACIDKTPEPMRPIRVINRSRGTFEAVYEKQGQPDYKGTIKGGRSVCFEAKNTDTDRIKQEAVQPHQGEALDFHESMGALCFILVRMGLRYYRVPWTDWKNMRELFGHKYMNASDLKRYEIPRRNGSILFLSYM